METRPLRRLTSPHAISILALVLAVTSPAWGDPVAHTTASAGKKIRQALGFSKKADKRSRKAIKTANEAKSLALAKKQGEKGDKGDKGDPGPTGATGLTGAKGSALAYGEVDGNTGDISKNTSNASAVKLGGPDGQYCITVQGANPANRPILLTPGLTSTTGIATIVDQADTLTGSIAAHGIVEWNSASTCNVSNTGYLVQTKQVRIAPASDQLIIENQNKPFAFAIP